MDIDKAEPKRRILDHLNFMLSEKIESLQTIITSAKESRDSETKSSVGDKYETSRTMAQIEIQKNETQLQKTRMLQKELSKIEINKIFDVVEFGSLVLTNQEHYFISLGLGKIIVDEKEIFAISLASPIGKSLEGKKIGDTVQFQQKEIEILEIA